MGAKAETGDGPHLQPRPQTSGLLQFPQFREGGFVTWALWVLHTVGYERYCVYSHLSVTGHSSLSVPMTHLVCSVVFGE